MTHTIDQRGAHTPGPWIIKDEEGKYLARHTGWQASFERDDMSEAEEENGEYRGITSMCPIMTEDKSKAIALAVGFGFADETEQLAANARLIAAAPELLNSAKLENMIYPSTPEAHEELKSFSRSLGWKEDKPIEHFAVEYRRAAIAAAQVAK